MLAALSYVGDRPVLWRVVVSERADQAAWECFFAQLPGAPTFVTSDRDQAMLNAIAATWPDAKVYPCAHHLRANVEAILREGVCLTAAAPSSGRCTTAPSSTPLPTPRSGPSRRATSLRTWHGRVHASSRRCSNSRAG